MNRGHEAEATLSDSLYEEPGVGRPLWEPLMPPPGVVYLWFTWAWLFLGASGGPGRRQQDQMVHTVLRAVGHSSGQHPCPMERGTDT